MTVNNRKLQRYEIVEHYSMVIYITIYLIMTILPMVKYSVPYIISAAFVLLFVAVFFLRYSKYRVVIVLLLICGFLRGLVSYLQGNSVISMIINEPIREIRYFAPCCIFIVLNETKKKTQLFIWFTITILLVYIAIRTSIALSSNPLMARYLAAGSKDDVFTKYRMQNLGGFEFSYAIGLTVPFLMMFFLKSKKTVLKIISFVLIILVFYYVLLTQYMTLFVICIGSIILSLIMGQHKILSKIIWIGVIIVFLLTISKLLRMIANLDIGDVIKMRIVGIADFLEGNSEISETTSRPELMGNAFIAFLKSPLIGEYNSEAALYSHSTILTFAASTGIIGLSTYLLSLFIYYKTVKNIFVKNGSVLVLFSIVYLCFFILAFVNPIVNAFEVSIVTFLYVPLSANLFFVNKERVSVIETQKHCEAHMGHNTL